MTKHAANFWTGGLSKPSKMPCKGYSLPATECLLGSRLRSVSGSVCVSCYALKGRYTFPNVQNAMARRYGCTMRALEDATTREHYVNAFVRLLEHETHFRWHDSGDLQSDAHLDLIVEIAKRLPQTSFWLPTREWKLVTAWRRAGGVFPDNLTVRMSAQMIDGPVPSTDLPTSGVHTHGNSQGRKCPAPTTDGHCGSCRACWDANVKHVSYLKH